MNKLGDLSCNEFLTELASAAPAPGGGGGAAMAGALAAALASMVANLTIGKEKFADREPEVKELLEAEAERVRLLTLVDEDAAVFNSFMSCYKLPKTTDEEKAARTAAIRAAAKQAATVPLNIARSSFAVLKLADRLVVAGNPGVITDGACSGLLARAALRCAEYNVRINLGLTKDEVWNAQAAADLKKLLADAEALETRLLAVTDKALQ